MIYYDSKAHPVEPISDVTSSSLLDCLLMTDRRYVQSLSLISVSGTNAPRDRFPESGSLIPVNIP